MMNLSLENRLLVSCVQAGVSETAVDKMKEIITLPLQWEKFLNSAFWHGVAPLVYGNLKDIPESRLVPSEIMNQLKEAYYATLVRNMLFYAELERVLDSFHEKGIEVILLKGVALAKTVYADIGMRPMGDVDIMVRRDDLPQAERRLSELGYIFHGKNPPEWWRENHYHIDFFHPENSLMIELHWHITNKINPIRIRDFDFDIIEGFWEKAGHGDFFGDNVRILSPEDSLLYLSIHFLKHRFYNSKNGGFTSKGALIQLCDILLTLRHHESEIDWERLGREAGQRRIYALPHLVTRLAMNILGEGKDISSAGGNGHKSRNSNQEILELMSKKIFIREETLPHISGSLINPFKENTFRDVALKILRDIFPSPEVISSVYSVPLSSKRLYLHYFKRPFNLLLKHKKIISEMPRMKDDVILNRWIHSLDTVSGVEEAV